MTNQLIMLHLAILTKRVFMGDISNYKRINARLNSTHKVFDFLTIGQTFLYTHQNLSEFYK
jgi:hypothetical protein